MTSYIGLIIGHFERDSNGKRDGDIIGSSWREVTDVPRSHRPMLKEKLR